MHLNVNTTIIVTGALEFNDRDECEVNKLRCENVAVLHTTDECAWDD